MAVSDIPPVNGVPMNQASSGEVFDGEHDFQDVEIHEPRRDDAPEQIDLLFKQQLLETNVPRYPSVPTEASAQDYGNRSRENDAAPWNKDKSLRNDVFSKDQQHEQANTLGHADGFQYDQKQTRVDTGSLLSLTGDMKKKLNDSMYRYKFIADESLKFLPRSRLLEICNYQAVLEELEKVEPFKESKKAQACAEYICGPRLERQTDARYSAREIFAVLVLIKEVPMMWEFWHANIRDDDLPLECSDDKQRIWTRQSKLEVSNGDRQAHRQRSRRDQKEDLKFFQDEALSGAAENFFNQQWCVRINTITLREIQRLHSNAVLPLTQFGPKEVGKGAHGKVYCVKIHHSHQFFPKGLEFDKEGRFALKVFMDVDTHKRSFKTELKAFQQTLPLPHVIEHLATFEIGNRCMFLLPWAAGGSLDTLMRRSPPVGSGASMDDRIEYTKWLHQQCAGLAQGLYGIHGWLERCEDAKGKPCSGNPDDCQIYGIHSDIKPANILVFMDSSSRWGTLKLADFGCLVYHSSRTRTQKNENSAPADHIYQSPEFTFGQIMSRKVDIWALGCVFTEILTWSLKGPESLDTFKRKRREEPYRDWKGETKEVIDESYYTQYPRSSLTSVQALFGTKAARTNDNPYVEPRVKMSVYSWMEDLKSASVPGGSGIFLTEFLDMIHTQMLNVSKDDRADCGHLKTFFERCRHKGDGTPDYWVSHSPNRWNEGSSRPDKAHLSQQSNMMWKSAAIGTWAMLALGYLVEQWRNRSAK